MTDRETAAVRARAKVWYGLVVVLLVNMVLTGATFLGAAYWATRNAEQEQGRVLCPLVLILQSAYHAPSAPQTPTLIQLRNATDSLALALHCAEIH